MKTLDQLLKYYQFITKDSFFAEMENCLEYSGINESNYALYICEFEKSYPSWIESNCF